MPAVVIRRHPWEVARLDFFRRQLRSRGLDRRPLEVLDVGSGDAWLAMSILPALHADSSITCWDAAYGEAQVQDLTRQADPRVRFVATQPQGHFDLALLLDVLEHIEGDDVFLNDVVDKNIRTGGHVLVSVPAWRILFGEHDVQLHHFRRYQPREAARLLERVGLEIVSRGGLFHTLIVPRVAERLAARAGLLTAPPPNAGEWKAGPLLTAVVEGLLKLDGRLSTLLSGGNLELPGLSWWAICVKPSS
jgi:2-polyprenyl-3-methyl-5-hydroxy-6-metoxy-1,4-benzoquinol methylase